MQKISLNVRPFQETLHSDMCGPASLKIVLDYYGVNKTEEELSKLSNFIPGIGMDDESIVEAATILGFKAEIINNNTFEDIESWLKNEIPVIVDWFTKGRSDYHDGEVADGHYSVVCGLDDGYIYLQDPEIGGIRKIERNDFMKVWFDFIGNVIKPGELIIRQIIAIYK